MKLHIILQSKGGVGKSLAAMVLAQYLAHRGQLPLCIDADPINKTLQGYPGLNAQCVDLLENNEIHDQRFCTLISLLTTANTDLVVDSATNSFVPLSHYLITQEIPALLEKLGHKLILHTIITGGQAFLDTLNSFAHLIQQMPKESLFIVWLNPFFGAIEHMGKGFEQTKAYLDNRQRLSALVQMPTLNRATFSHDLNNMLQARLLFDEALQDSTIYVYNRQRLKMIRDQFFAQLNCARVI
jgi:hypothetical protein